MKYSDGKIDVTVTQKQINQSVQRQEEMGRHNHEFQLKENEYKLKQNAYARVLELRKQLREAEEQFRIIQEPQTEPEPEVKYEIAKTFNTATGEFKDIKIPKPIQKKKSPNLVNGVWKY